MPARKIPTLRKLTLTGGPNGHEAGASELFLVDDLDGDALATAHTGAVDEFPSLYFQNRALSGKCCAGDYCCCSISIILVMGFNWLRERERERERENLGIFVVR